MFTYIQLYLCFVTSVLFLTLFFTICIPTGSAEVWQSAVCGQSTVIINNAEWLSDPVTPAYLLIPKQPEIWKNQQRRQLSSDCRAPYDLWPDWSGDPMMSPTWPNCGSHVNGGQTIWSCVLSDPDEWPMKRLRAIIVPVIKSQSKQPHWEFKPEHRRHCGVNTFPMMPRSQPY